MVRPRFHKLDPAKQELILDAALSEFAAHGFLGASLNRIIEAAGISKGSMYYYFDSKEDLYAHVIRDQVERLIGGAGPIPVPPHSDPDEYWTFLADLYLQLMKALMASPAVGSLLRGWLAGGGAPSLTVAQDEAEQAMLPWLLNTVAIGQQIGAVRTDLPTDLLLNLVMALGQAIDIWLINRHPADMDFEHTVRTLIDVIRRAIEPRLDAPAALFRTSFTEAGSTGAAREARHSSTGCPER